jgi:hypothetical protein
MYPALPGLDYIRNYNALEINGCVAMKNQPRLFSFFKANHGQTLKTLPPMPDVRRQCAWYRERVQEGGVK